MTTAYIYRWSRGGYMARAGRLVAHGADEHEAFWNLIALLRGRSATLDA